MLSRRSTYVAALLLCHGMLVQASDLASLERAGRAALVEAKLLEDAEPIEVPEPTTLEPQGSAGATPLLVDDTPLLLVPPGLRAAELLRHNRRDTPRLG